MMRCLISLRENYSKIPDNLIKIDIRNNFEYVFYLNFENWKFENHSILKSIFQEIEISENRKSNIKIMIQIKTNNPEKSNNSKNS